MTPVYLAIAALRFTAKKRRGVCPRRVEELRAQLEMGGEIYPIRVNALGDGTYTVKDGRHRVQAHIAAGLSEIIAYIENTVDRITSILRTVFRTAFNSLFPQ